MPEGMEEFWLNQSKQFNQDSIQYIAEIRKEVKNLFEIKLSAAYGKDWLIRALPKPIYQKINNLVDDHKYELAMTQEELTEDISAWDFVTLSDCRTIALSGSHWSTIFESCLNAVGKDNFVSTISGNYTDKIISKIANPVINYNNGNITWETINNAIDYTILIDDIEVSKITDLFYTVPQFIESDKHQIVVRANATNDYISSFSSVIQNNVLTNIDFSVNNDVLTWTNTNDATNYIVFVNSQKFCFDNTITSMNLNNIENGNVSISVIGLQNNNGILNIVSSNKVDYNKLNSVVGLSISNGVLTWNNVNGAESYQVKIADSIYNVSTNAYSFDNVKQDGEQNIYVSALASGKVISSTPTLISIINASLAYLLV